MNEQHEHPAIMWAILCLSVAVLCLSLKMMGIAP